MLGEELFPRILKLPVPSVNAADHNGSGFHRMPAGEPTYAGEFQSPNPQMNSNMPQSTNLSARPVYRILLEASGSLVSSYMIKAIQEAGHQAVASDINSECVGRYLADDFVEMPRASDSELWGKMTRILEEKKIDLVIPSLDESLIGWSKRGAQFAASGVEVVLSNASTLEICLDKWKTYRFFEENGIPTPSSSLEQEYSLVKPRCGRGGIGVVITSEPVEMDGMISQEVIRGTEYTVDVLCDKDGSPIYISPRRRLVVRDGKSVAGIVDCRPDIVAGVRSILRSLPFKGPINIQCFLTEDGRILFLEINPRIGGGMALGFAASENWIPLIVRNFVKGAPLVPGEVRSGTRMLRYYAEVIVSAS